MSLEVKIQTLAPQPVLSQRFSIAPAEMGAKLGQVLPAVLAFAGSRGIAVEGAPFSRYHTMDEGTLDLEAGLPVGDRAGGEGDIVASELPGGKVAVTWHVGPYDALGETHQALQAWAREHGHRVGSGPWEVYVTDPASEPDPSKWRTQIFLPLI